MDVQIGRHGTIHAVCLCAHSQDFGDKASAATPPRLELLVHDAERAVLLQLNGLWGAIDHL